MKNLIMSFFFLYSVIEDSKSLSHVGLLQFAQAFLNANIKTYKALGMYSLHSKVFDFLQAKQEKRTDRQLSRS